MVAIIPGLNYDCYLHDAETNTLFIKHSESIVPLELAGVEPHVVLELAVVGLATMSETDRKRVQTLLKRVFPCGVGAAIGRDTMCIEYSISSGDARPVKQRYYPVSKVFFY